MKRDWIDDGQADSMEWLQHWTWVDHVALWVILIGCVLFVGVVGAVLASQSR